MKNLLIYLNPAKEFDEESAKLIKIQVDNSLELGWVKENIILFTNFPYKYKGVEAKVIENGYCEFKKELTKITTLTYLYDVGLIEDKTLYWCHDLDAYQLEPISESELGLTKLDAGFCDYCRVPKWQLGSFFFKMGAEDIFREIAKRIRPGFIDEDAMVEMTNKNIVNINHRIKRLNGTYDFGMRRIDYCYEKAIKPLKVLHFHPHNPLLNTLAIAMHGKNRIGKPLMTERLIKVFNRYNYF